MAQTDDSNDMEDPTAQHRLRQRRRRHARHAALASLYIEHECLPMDVTHLITEFVGPDRPLTVELRDGYLMQERANNFRTPRLTNYYTAKWLQPTEHPKIEWASIRLVQSAVDSDTYYACIYAKECRQDLPGGAHLVEPLRNLPGAEDSFTLHFVEEGSYWKYTGRGVTLKLPVESRLFFPHNMTQYHYKQAGRRIYGQLVHGQDFIWKDRVKGYRTTIAEIEDRKRFAKTMAGRLASTIGIVFGIGGPSL